MSVEQVKSVELHKPLVIVNHAGFAEYRCGICCGELIKLVNDHDMDTPLPKVCPHCGQYVQGGGRR